ncbi:MAG: hypothetical protein ABIB43_03795 [archaeon]
MADEKPDLKILRIGVVGYVPPSKFNVRTALKMIRDSYNQLDELYKEIPKEVVSGWINAGIPKIAYREAVRRGWKSKGIAHMKVNGLELFPVDEAILYGPKKGDESQTFVNSIDVLVKIGGGAQPAQEEFMMRRRDKLVLHYDLPLLE